MTQIIAALVALSALGQPSTLDFAQQQFNITFSGADVTMALKAISIKTGANIVVSGSGKGTVTLNMSVGSVEEAVRAVSSAAGVIYRKVGTTYIVAPEEAMKKALEPYAKRASLSVNVQQPDRLITRLKESLPYANFSLIAGKVSALGISEDLALAQQVAEDYALTEAENLEVSEAVLVEKGRASEIAKVLTGLYPKIKVSSTEGTGQGGAIGLLGPAGMVRTARDLAKEIDKRSDDADAHTVYEVYQLKYSSGPQVVDFINKGTKDKSALIQGVEAFVAPESFSPRRPKFNPLTAQLGTTIGSITGAGGGGTTTQTQNQNQNGDVQTQVVPGERAKAIVLKGSGSGVAQAKALISQLDIKPQQVVIEVHVIETTPEAGSKTGIDWNWSPFDFHEVPPGTAIASNPAGGAFSTAVTRPAGLGQFSRLPTNFRAILSAMVTNQTAKILAQPSLQVIDNDQASFFIGNTIRARIVTQGALGSQNVQIQEFPVGIILLVAPRVNTDGNITLRVNPVVSTVTAVDADNVPQTAAREAETTAVVKDGETVVIGGLIREDELKTLSEIPILSKIPILGELFKSRTTSHKKTDLVISITPHIVKDVGSGAGK